jgi:hypothetical protein
VARSDDLTIVRGVWLAVAVSLALFARQVSWLVEDDGGPAVTWWVVGLLVFQLWGLLAAAHFRFRGRGPVREMFLIAIAFAASGPLVGFNLAFMAPASAIYFASLPLAAVGLAIAVPTKARFSPAPPEGSPAPPSR